MVHDLTANRDFQENRIRVTSTRATFDDDTLTSPYKEVVLTGTAFDRDTKRYFLDYESDRKNMCDCCGAPIKIRPWDFENDSSLCPGCEKRLEEMLHLKEGNGLYKEIVDESLTVRVMKPWDISNSERENAIDNVLLWD